MFLFFRLLIVFVRRHDLIFIFNFGNNSIENYQFYSPYDSPVKVVFSSDDKCFGGFERIDKDYSYQKNHDNLITIYIPSRTAFVLKKN